MPRSSRSSRPYGKSHHTDAGITRGRILAGAGSPSSELPPHTWAGNGAGMKHHFSPVGKPAPPARAARTFSLGNESRPDLSRKNPFQSCIAHRALVVLQAPIAAVGLHQDRVGSVIPRGHLLPSSYEQPVGFSLLM